MTKDHRRRTHFVPRLVFQTALTTVVPALATSCGGEVEEDRGGTGGTAAAAGTGGSDVIVLAMGGFGPTGGRPGTGGNIIVLATGGFGPGTGGFGWGGVIVLAIGGYGGYAGFPVGGMPPQLDGGPDASPDAGPDAAPAGDAGVDGSIGTGGSIIVLAINGFGADPSGSRQRG